MTVLTWLFFGMTALIFFILGGKFQRWRDKEMHRLAKEIIEEAKRNNNKTSGL